MRQLWISPVCSMNFIKVYSAVVWRLSIPFFRQNRVGLSHSLKTLCVGGYFLYMNKYKASSGNVIPPASPPQPISIQLSKYMDWLISTRVCSGNRIESPLTITKRWHFILCIWSYVPSSYVASKEGPPALHGLTDGPHNEAPLLFFSSSMPPGM